MLISYSLPYITCVYNCSFQKKKDKKPTRSKSWWTMSSLIQSLVELLVNKDCTLQAQCQRVLVNFSLPKLCQNPISCQPTTSITFLVVSKNLSMYLLKLKVLDRVINKHKFSAWTQWFYIPKITIAYRLFW